MTQVNRVFGYLPFKTLLLAFVLAFVFRCLGLNAEFLESNASWPNLWTGVSITAFLLVFYFLSFLWPYDESVNLQRFRALITEYIKFSFDLAFFAIGFILVFEYKTPGYWWGLLGWLPLYVVGFLAFNHVLLVVNGEEQSSVKFTAWVDKKFGWDKFQNLKNPSFNGLLGIIFTIIFLSVVAHLKAL